MDSALDVFDDPDALSEGAARHVAERARAAVAADDEFHFAVSGGRTPWEMFARLAGAEMPWERTVIWQVDERVAPADDPDRNLTHLRRALGDAPAHVRPMPVEDDDLEEAAARYAAGIPDLFHLVHLGIGPDGHTASLLPTDPVLGVNDRLVAVTANAYEGRRRMTLTYPALARAKEILWLVSGADKRDVLARLLAGDQTIPAGRVVAGSSVVMADRSAV
jgi:6-phosphogluconolactonase